MALLPFPGGADQAVGDGAEPEIYNQAPVELKRLVARQGQGWRQQEVHHVAEDDGAESLEQIYEHRGFRHRLRGAWLQLMMRTGHPSRLCSIYLMNGAAKFA
jgi:hypothetical protein